MKCAERGTVVVLVEHGVHAGIYEKSILSLICKYLHVVKCCAFVSHAHFLLSNVYLSPRESAESVAVTRMDDFVRGGKLPSLTDRFLWRVSQGQPAAAHHYRYAFDICSPRSSSVQSKTPPVGFYKKPDSWIICGGLNVAMSCTTLSFHSEGLHQPTSVFCSPLSTLIRSNAVLLCKLPATTPCLRAAPALACILQASSTGERTGKRKKGLGGTGRERVVSLGWHTRVSSECFLSEISQKMLLAKP